jgi:amino acid transporter
MTTTDQASQQRLESLGYRQELSRTMSLYDVVVYGLVFMVPFAPIPVFGLIYNFSGGLVPTVYIVAAVAMYFSAVSYCEMARQFPLAGSVYSYVKFGAGDLLGFLSGWAILLDYLLLPGLVCIFTAIAMHLEVPAIPEWVWVPIFLVITTLINLRGIAFTAKVNLACLYIQLIVLAAFVIGVAVALAHGRIHLSAAPFYVRDTFSVPRIFSAIPIAALSYIGFDAISTLNEEAKGGGQTVSKATMIVLVAVAALFVLQVYLASLFVPTGTVYDADAAGTAFYDIADVAMGSIFKWIITLSNVFIAMLANAIVSQATTARLLFSMARDRQIPVFLAAVDADTKIPVRATLAVTVVSLIIGIVAINQSYLITSMVTFGSLTAYALLHVAVIRHFHRRGARVQLFAHWVSPILGLLILGYTLWNSPVQAKVVGVGWLVLGGIMFRFRRTLSFETALLQAKGIPR